MKKSKYRKTRFFERLKKELNITNNDLKRKHLPKKNKHLKALYYKDFTNHVIKKYSEYRRHIIDDSITNLN